VQVSSNGLVHFVHERESWNFSIRRKLVSQNKTGILDSKRSGLNYRPKAFLVRLMISETALFPLAIAVSTAPDKLLAAPFAFN
jgi:hypothetical protein